MNLVEEIQRIEDLILFQNGVRIYLTRKGKYGLAGFRWAAIQRFKKYLQDLKLELKRLERSM